MFLLLKKNTFNILFTFTLMVLITFTSNINAHEMWLEPVNFSIKVHDKLSAHEKVGQNFKGNSYSYLESSFEELNISQAGSSRAVNSRFGDKPIIQEVVKSDGLVILSAVSKGSELVYGTKEKFETFIKSEKLDWVFKEHKKRNLPDKGFVEIFRRYPKSLVKVGSGKGRDRVLGLPLEWILKTNPYTSDTDIKACLIWQNNPLVNKDIQVFSQTSLFEDGLNTEESAIATNSQKKEISVVNSWYVTDKNGCVVIPRGRGMFLLSAVKMIEPSAEVKIETSAVWESLWASMTYSTE